MTREELEEMTLMLRAGVGDAGVMAAQLVTALDKLLPPAPDLKLGDVAVTYEYDGGAVIIWRVQQCGPGEVHIPIGHGGTWIERRFCRLATPTEKTVYESCAKGELR